MFSLKFDLALAVLITGLTQRTAADEVLDWNAVLRRAVVTSDLPGPAHFRLAAIVQTAVFDAENGIDRQFTALHVPMAAPQGASRRAAAVQAAYSALIALLPAQKASFDQDLQMSLARIAANVAVESSESIASGRAWGDRVANEILAWRSRDGFDPAPSTCRGSELPGKWRPTPPAFGNG